MKFIADFHIHSKYSRATSKDMDFETISQWAKWKGITLLGTGDFTHPLWLSEIKRKLKPIGNGLFSFSKVNYILSTEICNIFNANSKTKKIHTMVFAPSIQVAEKINKELSRYCDLTSDGRPIIPLPLKNTIEIVFSASKDCVVVPCHIWTPHFSLFGANSGFDTFEECFEEYSRNIFAVETGLSSDPQMNWEVQILNNIALISNSDAHSPSKIGRECNVFDTELSYKGIFDAIKSFDPQKFLYTIEFFPQEGKYYLDGHRNCKVSLMPKESKKTKNKCPKCGNPLTIGVLNRIENLKKTNANKKNLPPKARIPYKNLIPLIEIISEAFDKDVDSAFVKDLYLKTIFSCGNEFDILLEKDFAFLSQNLHPLVVEGIKRVRGGQVKIECGYDGVYGKIKIFDKYERENFQRQPKLF